VAGTTPVEVAQRIEEHADRALGGAEALRPAGSFELWQQLDDIRAMASLGKHYSHKIRAATEIALYWATNAREHRLKGIDHARMAAFYWRTYVSYLSAAYQSSIWFNRIGEVDWKLFYLDVLHDVRSLGGAPDIPSMEPTKGGTILEAEAGRTDAPESSLREAGPGGPGYLELSAYRSGDRYIEWDYDAPADGWYVLEVRYSAGYTERSDARVVIDGETAGSVGLWGTGGGGNWCWDRMSVTLGRGRHIIRLYPNGEFRIDHLNVIPIQ
jgi:hypothetical protein